LDDDIRGGKIRHKDVCAMARVRHGIFHLTATVSFQVTNPQPCVGCLARSEGSKWLNGSEKARDLIPRFSSRECMDTHPNPLTDVHNLT
jgi:hypothetical protein